MAVAAARNGSSSAGGSRAAAARNGVANRRAAAAAQQKQQQKRASSASSASTSAPIVIPYRYQQPRAPHPYPTPALGQDATLRSALAFVVLRRRLAAKAAAAAASATASALGRKKKRSRENAPTYEYTSALTPLALPGQPITDKSHVSHLVRLAIRTALPLGNDVLGIGIGAAGRRGPIVYNHQLAASSSSVGAVGGNMMQQHHQQHHQQQLAVLDGLLTNLSAKLSVVARASPGDARAIVREEFLDVLLTRAEEFEYRSDGRGGSSDDAMSRLLFSGEEEDGGNHHRRRRHDDGGVAAAAAASARLLFDRTRLCLAVCTVLHRLVVCGADCDALPAAIVGAASSYLRHVYDGSYQDGFDVVVPDGGIGARRGRGGTRRRKRVSFAFDEDYDDDEDDDDEDDDEDESAATVTAQVIPLPRIGDTVAVNVLILLEEVSLARCARHSYSFSYSASNDMLKSLRGGFGEDLLLSPPLTVTSDAAMFVRREELRVVAETRRRRRRMKKKRAGAGAGAGVFPAVGAAASGGGGVEYIPLLDAGAKLMLRLTLWDLVERLSV